MFKTAITEMFGVKYPIICGAMMWLCKPKLCAAVSNAGGIGNLTAGNYETADEFRAAIRETRKLTDKPFFVAITLLPSVRITPEHHKMYVKVCAEEKVAGIEFSGTPLDKVAGMEAVELLKKAGVKMFHKVGAVRHALHAEKIGFDGIYAAGIEEGGHPLNDDVTSMVLTPQNCLLGKNSRCDRRRHCRRPDHGGGAGAGRRGRDDGQPLYRHKRMRSA